VHLSSAGKKNCAASKINKGDRIMAAFDVSKVMGLLAGMEAEGYTFYEEAAQAIDEESTKNLFLKLAKDERKHEAFYLKQLEQYKDKTYEIDEEDADFLNMLLNQPSPLDIAKKAAQGKLVWNKLHALNMAERLERDTILFLQQIIASHKDFSKEKAFTDALKEEKHHLKLILQSTMDMVSSSLML